MDAQPCGEGGLPTPPRKNDQNGGEAAGQNKGPILKSFRSRKPLMVQYYKTEQCPIQPVNRIFKRHHPLHPLQSNTESYSCVILRESEFHLVKAHPCPNINLSAADDDGDYDGDDNHDGVHPKSHKHKIPCMGFCASVWDSVRHHCHHHHHHHDHQK